MCRSITILRQGAEPSEDEAIEEAALQFVRKISGFRKPAAHNQEVFDQAVAEITEASRRLMHGLEIRGAASRR